MAYIELNWKYMHERVNKFINGVIDDIGRANNYTLDELYTGQYDLV